MVGHGVIVRLKRLEGFFHQPSTEVVEGESLDGVFEKKKLVNMQRFEVCFDCSDDSPVNPMGYELAV